MQLFFATHIQGQTAILEVEETRHMTKVLRLGAGAEVRVTDGKGSHYIGQFYPDKGGRALVQIQQQLDFSGHPQPRIHLAVAPTKNIERIEWLLEKATEVGLASFTPLLCQRSERKVLKEERLERIVLAAMKQSGRAWLPTIHPMQKLTDFLKTPLEGQRLIAHCDAHQPRQDFKKQVSPSGPVVVLIGPEGDFSPIEVELALNAGFEAVTFGDFRLRTETAALYACIALE
jgi:16S rRNA (uracil1498-N3)-methyltransferase